MAHVDAGKTTVTERMLYYSGLIHKIGNVDDGNTVMDSDPQEEKRGITISSACISTFWKYKDKNQESPFKINIIDTPGHIDFSIEVERSLRVLDGVVALFCASSGVEPQSENVWHLATKYDVPRVCFINKMDRQGADFFAVIKQIRERLGTIPVALQIPIGAEDDFIGVVDLINMESLIWDSPNGETWRVETIPTEMLEECVLQRSLLIETIADYDDELLEVYLNNDHDVDVNLLLNAIRRTTINMDVTPVFCGSAYKNKGVQPLLDAVVRYLPSPTDLSDIEGINTLDDSAISLKRNENEIFSALAFKIVMDKHMGKLTLVRIYSGSLPTSSTILNSRTGQKIRVNRILEIKADNYINLDVAKAGSICALVGLKDVKMGDTLCNVEHSFRLESIEVPEPVINIAVEVKKSADYKKFGQALSMVMESDPSLQIKYDEQTSQTILKGMGELHLEVVLEKLRADYGLDLSIGKPRVAYREAINKTVKHRAILKKQTGGSGQFADLTFEVSPGKQDSLGLELVNSIKGGAISKECIPSIEKGFIDAMKSGVLGRFPLENLKVTLLDGKMHDNDSTPLDFEKVAKHGFKDACKIAEPYLLEPIMSLEINCSEDHIGAISSDLNRRRGIILSIDDRGVQKLMKADVPLENTFGYIGSLRSLTSGRANFSMKFSHFSKVPENLLKDCLS